MERQDEDLAQEEQGGEPAVAVVELAQAADEQRQRRGRRGVLATAPARARDRPLRHGLFEFGGALGSLPFRRGHGAGTPALPLALVGRLEDVVFRDDEDLVLVDHHPTCIQTEGSSLPVQVAPSGAAAQPKGNEQGAYQGVSNPPDPAKSHRSLAFRPAARAKEQNTVAIDSRRAAKTVRGIAESSPGPLAGPPSEHATAAGGPGEDVDGFLVVRAADESCQGVEVAHQSGELLRKDCLWPVGEGPGGIVVYLDHDAVGPGGDGGTGEGDDLVAPPGAVAGIDQDRQVAAVFQGGPA